MAKTVHRQSSKREQLAVLIVAPYFLPAVLAGGPIRSIAGIVDQLHDEFTFYVLAVNHDSPPEISLQGIKSSSWISQSACHVRYEPDRKFTLGNYRSWILETRPSVIYLNTFFSTRFSLLPLLAALSVRRVRPTVVLAPRGSLMSEALNLKSSKKRMYLVGYRLMGLSRRTTWHATSIEEETDLRKLFGSRIAIVRASEVRVREMEQNLELPMKVPGELRVIFLSRISPKKNLVYAIQRLANVDGKVHFTIAGPGEDAKYVLECEALIRSLPPSVTVEFIGPVEHDEVARTIAAHHLFFLPSLAENYGHAIVEALTCPRPVLIGNRTPWHNLAGRGLGNELPLAEPLAFERVLQLACDQSQDDFVRQVGAMTAAVRELLDTDAALEQNRSLFRVAARQAGTA